MQLACYDLVPHSMAIPTGVAGPLIHSDQRLAEIEISYKRAGQTLGERGVRGEVPSGDAPSASTEFGKGGPMLPTPRGALAPSACALGHVAPVGRDVVTRLLLQGIEAKKRRPPLLAGACPSCGRRKIVKRHGKRRCPRCGPLPDKKGDTT